MQRPQIITSTIALLLLVAIEVTAQTRPLELQDYYRLESADNAALSPDGRWVAFVRSY